MNQFAIDRRHGVLLVTFEGPVSPERLDALDDELKALVFSEGTMPMIIDFTGVSSVQLDSSILVTRGKNRSQMTGKPRVFVSNSPLLYGLLRIYGAHQDNTGEKTPAIVKSLAAAFVKLSLIGPEFEPVELHPPDTTSPGDVVSRRP